MPRPTLPTRSTHHDAGRQIREDVIEPSRNTALPAKACLTRSVVAASVRAGAGRSLLS